MGGEGTGRHRDKAAHEDQQGAHGPMPVDFPAVQRNDHRIEGWALVKDCEDLVRNHQTRHAKCEEGTDPSHDPGAVTPASSTFHGPRDHLRQGGREEDPRQRGDLDGPKVPSTGGIRGDAEETPALDDPGDVERREHQGPEVVGGGTDRERHALVAWQQLAPSTGADDRERRGDQEGEVRRRKQQQHVRRATGCAGAVEQRRSKGACSGQRSDEDGADQHGKRAAATQPRQPERDERTDVSSRTARLREDSVHSIRRQASRVR